MSIEKINQKDMQVIIVIPYGLHLRVHNIDWLNMFRIITLTLLKNIPNISWTFFFFLHFLLFYFFLYFCISYNEQWTMMIYNIELLVLPVTENFNGTSINSTWNVLMLLTLPALMFLQWLLQTNFWPSSKNINNCRCVSIN